MSNFHESGIVVPYPYGSNIGISERAPYVYLSAMSQLCLDAALDIKGPSDAVVLIGETCFPGLPNANQLMQEKAAAQGASAGHLHVVDKTAGGECLNNTYVQAQGLAECVQGVHGNITIVTMEYHAKRVIQAQKIFPELGNAEMITVESILGNMAVACVRPLLNELSESEARLLRVGQYDQFTRFKFLRYMGRKIGPRIVDMHVDDEGRVAVENTLARKKQKYIDSMVKKGQVD